MTDNEKRAHDLAIAMIPVGVNNFSHILKQKTVPEDSSLDVYAFYLSVYKANLEQLNRDFPDGN